MWLLHPSPRANGNYATLWRHNVSLWRHNFRYPSGRGAIISHYVWAHYLAKNIAVFASFKAFYIGTYRCNLRHTLFLRLPLLLGRRSHHISNLTIICYEIVVNAPATRLMTGITVVVASSVHIALENVRGMDNWEVPAKCIVNMFARWL